MRPSHRTTVSDVFQQYLKELAIHDFPTGAGCWVSLC